MSTQIEVPTELSAKTGQKEPFVWLTWTLNTRGLVTLRSIDTETAHKDYAVSCFKNDPSIVRVWVEKAMLNHLYGDFVHGGEMQ